MTYIKIKDHINLVRDDQSRAVLNINVKGKQEFLVRREESRKLKKAIERQETLEERMLTIEQKLDMVLKALDIKT